VGGSDRKEIDEEITKGGGWEEVTG